MTTVSPFARSNAFEDWTVSAGRDMSVSRFVSTLVREPENACFLFQVEEMYSIPESFLEIEVRNPQTHGEQLFALSSSTLLS